MRTFFTLMACMMACLCHAFEEGGLYYSIQPGNSSEVRVCKYRYTQREIIVPGEVTHNGRTYKVTGYEDGAFAGTKVRELVLSPNAPIVSYKLCQFSEIEVVIVPNGVTEIDGLAFKDCKYLSCVRLPKNSLTIIGMQAFANCPALQYLRIPASVTMMGTGQCAHQLCIEPSNEKLTIVSEATVWGGDGYTGFTCQDLMLDRSVQVLLKSFDNKKSVPAIFSPKYSALIGRNAGNFQIHSSTLESLFMIDKFPPSVYSGQYEVNQSTCRLYTYPNSVERYGIARFWQDFRHIESLTGCPIGLYYPWENYYLKGVKLTEGTAPDELDFPTPGSSANNSEPPAPQHPKNLSVILTDPGATVYINNEKMGRGNWTDDVDPGWVFIKVTDLGCEDFTDKVFINKGEVVYKQIPPLTRKELTTGMLYVASRPAGATVTIDDKEVGTTPILVTDLSPRSMCNVKVTHEGYAPASQSIKIKESSSSDTLPQMAVFNLADLSLGGGHDFVDLGLPSGTLWATMNLGASSPEEQGDQYGWGQIIPVDTTLSHKKITKANQKYAKKIYKNGAIDISGDSLYDAAMASWGGNWRIPTYKEIKELDDNCKFTFAESANDSGKKIIVVTGPNGTMTMPWRHTGIKYWGESWYVNLSRDWGDEKRVKTYTHSYWPDSKYDIGISCYIRPVMSAPVAPALEEMVNLDDVKAEYAAKFRVARNKSLTTYTTPDLRLFDVHGPVRSITSSPLASYVFASNGNNATYFDRNGFSTKTQPDEHFWGFDFDKQGCITGFIFAPDGGSPVHTLEWNKNGYLIKEFDAYGSHSETRTFVYDENGDLKQIQCHESYNGGACDTVTDYEITERDGRGNWIKRRVTSTIITTNANTYPLTTKEKKEGPKMETRTITYYN